MKIKLAIISLLIIISSVWVVIPKLKIDAPKRLVTQAIEVEVESKDEIKIEKSAAVMEFEDYQNNLALIKSTEEIYQELKKIEEKLEIERVLTRLKNQQASKKDQQVFSSYLRLKGQYLYRAFEIDRYEAEELLL